MAIPAPHPNYYIEIATQVASGLLLSTGIYISLGGKMPYLLKPYIPNVKSISEGLRPTAGHDLPSGVDIKAIDCPQNGYYAVEVDDDRCVADKLGDLEIIDVERTPCFEDNYYAVAAEDSIYSADKFGNLDIINIEETLRPQNNFYAVDVEDCTCLQDKIGDLEVKCELENEAFKVETTSRTERIGSSFGGVPFAFYHLSRFRELVFSFPVKLLGFTAMVACATIATSLVSSSFGKKLLRHIRDSIIQDVKNELMKENQRLRRELAEATLFIVNRLENLEKAIEDLENVATVMNRLEEQHKDTKKIEDAFETLVENFGNMQTLFRTDYTSHRMAHHAQSSKLRDLGTDIHNIGARLANIERSHSVTNGKVDLLQDQRHDYVAAMRKYSTLNLEANNAYAQKISSMDKDNVEGIMAAFLDVVSLEMRWNQDQVAQVKKRVERLYQAVSTPTHFHQK